MLGDSLMRRKIALADKWGIWVCNCLLRISCIWVFVFAHTYFLCDSFCGIIKIWFRDIRT